MKIVKMQRISIVLVFIFILLIFIFPIKAQAYTLNGSKLGGSISFLYSSYITAAGVSDILLAAATWNYYLPSSYLQKTIGTHSYLSGFPRNDGVSQIFKYANGYTGEVATTQRYVSGTIDGYSRTSSADILLNTTYPYANNGSTGNGTYDVRSVMLHELGHVIGLSHSSYTTAVMHKTASTTVQKRTPTTDDLSGLSYIYR